jgi:putative nucleotidyltransferase with HDIG domain
VGSPSTAARDPSANPDRGVAELGDVAQNFSVERALDAMRELLDMEVAFASEFADGAQLLHHLRGDGASFGIAEGGALPFEQTYCKRILDGRLPNMIPDVRGDDRAASLAITDAADVGAFVSVPLVFSNGRVHGTLCAGSHSPKPALGYRELRILRVFARLVAYQLEREALISSAEEVQRAAHELELQAAAANALVAAVEARDSYTGDHSKAVVDSAEAVARRLGLCEADVIHVKHVALLHDIGKIAVPDAILQKPGPLTDEEREVMRRHPACSAEMIAGVPALRHLAPLLHAEHERWDGTGYPDGLAGEAIPLPSRITLVCDAYHAMTSDRPYRLALSPEDARAEIRAGLGTQFCPAAGQAFLDITHG